MVGFWVIRKHNLTKVIAFFKKLQFLLEYFCNKNNITKLVVNNTLSEKVAEIVGTGC